MLTRTPVLPVLIIALALSSLSVQAHAQAAEHDHGAAHAHAHAEHGAAALSLNNGEQWETDEALRHGMTEVRAAIAISTPAFEAGQLSKVQAQQLSQAIHGSVNTMIEQCELAPEADANLHSILAMLLEGTAKLEAEPMSADGLPALHGALETYAHYFNHVGWQSDAHAEHAH